MARPKEHFDDPPSPSSVRYLLPSTLQGLVLSILAIVAVTFALHQAREVFIPIVLSILISYALDPIVAAFERWRVPRGVSALVLVVMILMGLGATIYSYRHDAVSAVERIAVAAKKFRQTLRDNGANGAGALDKMNKAVSELEKAAAEATRAKGAPSGNVMPVQVEEKPLDVSQYLWWGSMGVMAGLGQAVMILFLVYFILACGDLYKRKLTKIIGPLLAQRREAAEILTDMNDQIQRFLLIQLFSCAVVGVASWLAFHWIGLEQAGFWGMAAGLLNLIPYFGPVLVAGGVAIVGLVQFGSLNMVALLVCTSLVITSLEGYLLLPWLVGKTAEMNAVAVFVGLLFWGWVWGTWGLLLAVPMLMAIKVVCDHIEGLEFVGELLGE